jgi:N-acetylglucosamine-6-phosphate deacetylase
VRVRCDGGRIASIEAGVDPRNDDVRHENATLAPGLVDLQVNGGDGAAYDEADVAARRRATDFHLRSGTTSLLATLVSAPIEHLECALERLRADASSDGPVVGIHLEGPFLAEGKRGAHASAHLCDPTPDRVARMIKAAGSALRLVTLAPERSGGQDAVAKFAAAGAVVAAGHSLATLAELRAAIARGLSFVTHVGNASDWPGRPFDARAGFRRSEPNVVGAFLVERRLRGSVILDGHHLHPELARALVELRGADAVALVSDATPATGLPPGRYRIGGLDAEIRPEGYATTGKLAGSVVTLVDRARGGAAGGDPLTTACAWPARHPRRSSVCKKGQPRRGRGRGLAGARTLARARGDLQRGGSSAPFSGPIGSVTQEDRMRKLIRGTFVALALVAVVGLVPAPARGRLRGFARRPAPTEGSSTRWIMRPISFATMLVGGASLVAFCGDRHPVGTMARRSSLALMVVPASSPSRGRSVSACVSFGLLSRSA